MGAGRLQGGPRQKATHAAALPQPLAAPQNSSIRCVVCSRPALQQRSPARRCVSTERTPSRRHCTNRDLLEFMRFCTVADGDRWREMRVLHAGAATCPLSELAARVHPRVQVPKCPCLRGVSSAPPTHSLGLTHFRWSPRNSPAANWLSCLPALRHHTGRNSWRASVARRAAGRWCCSNHKQAQ